MTLGGSPKAACVCGHKFHNGPCDGTAIPCGFSGLAVVRTFCDCPDGELDADR